MATAKVSPTTDEFEPTNSNGRDLDHDTELTGNWFARDQVNSESNENEMERKLESTTAGEAGRKGTSETVPTREIISKRLLLVFMAVVFLTSLVSIVLSLVALRGKTSSGESSASGTGSQQGRQFVACLLLGKAVPLFESAGKKFKKHRNKNIDMTSIITVEYSDNGIELSFAGQDRHMKNTQTHFMLLFFSSTELSLQLT